MARGKRPAPFRTRKLSLSAPMVLPRERGGRVGRRRTSTPLKGPHHTGAGPSGIPGPPPDESDRPRRGTRILSGRTGAASSRRPAAEVRGTTRRRWNRWSVAPVRATWLTHGRTSVRAPPMSGGPTRAPVPARAGTAAAVLRRRACPPAAGAGAAAQPPGGHGDRHGPRPRGGARRGPGGRADAVGPHRADPRRRDGRRPRAARGGAGGGD